MNDKNMFWLLAMRSVLIAMLLAGCGPVASPEARAGEWYANSEFGNFSFSVDSSGVTVTQVTYSFHYCTSDVRKSGTLQIDPGLSIVDNEFSIELPIMNIQGSFSRDGTHASGSWGAGGCSGKWTATKDQPAEMTQPTVAVVNIAGQIVFVSDRNGNDEIYLMEGISSDQINLSNSPEADWAPDFSPDDKKIAFASRRDGNAEVYVMNADGSSQTKLTTNPGDDFGPKWSPDGSKIAFISERGGVYEIYVMNANGLQEVNLTKNPSNFKGFQIDFNWSPDSKKVAYSSNRDGNREVYVVNADGSSLINLTNNPEMDSNPMWSLDGTRIFFNSNRDGNYEIYVMNADGTSPTNLTKNKKKDVLEALSPDGETIVFSSRNSGNDSDLYIMQVDGSMQFQITVKSGGVFGTQWSPNSAQIIFCAGKDIFLVNSDGSGLTNLTSNPWEDKEPSWSP